LRDVQAEETHRDSTGSPVASAIAVQLSLVEDSLTPLDQPPHGGRPLSGLDLSGIDPVGLDRRRARREVAAGAAARGAGESRPEGRAVLLSVHPGPPIGGVEGAATAAGPDSRPTPDHSGGAASSGNGTAWHPSHPIQGHGGQVK
jgi:hypothetical protein